MDPSHSLIVVGASAGGVQALLRLLPQLPVSLPAPILVVLHIGAHRSLLPELLNNGGPRRASFAQDGVTPDPGQVYVAPPDRHLLLESGRMRLFRGPKEHHARPAINPLFRSAALDQGPSVVGVVLTGLLDDGTAGLHAITACGGIAVIQDPEEAAEPSMPRSALASGVVDHVARLDAMADLLSSLVRSSRLVERAEAPEWLRIEHAVSLGKTTMLEVNKIGVPSAFTCPDCGGALFELHEGRPTRFLCHTGHAFSLRSLVTTQEPVTDAALWSGLRALQEKESMLRRLAAELAKDAPGSGASALAEADKLAAFISQMRGVVTSAPAGVIDEDLGATADEPGY